VQNFWEVRRDSNAKSSAKGSYPQGRIIWRTPLGVRPKQAKLLTAKRKPV
jgi:hypothetical protein